MNVFKRFLFLTVLAHVAFAFAAPARATQTAYLTPGPDCSHYSYSAAYRPGVPFQVTLCTYSPMPAFCDTTVLLGAYDSAGTNKFIVVSRKLNPILTYETQIVHNVPIIFDPTYYATQPSDLGGLTKDSYSPGVLVGGYAIMTLTLVSNGDSVHGQYMIGIAPGSVVVFPGADVGYGVCDMGVEQDLVSPYILLAEDIYYVPPPSQPVIVTPPPAAPVVRATRLEIPQAVRHSDRIQK